MVWEVIFHPAFELEFDALAQAVQDEIFAHASFLAKLGPVLGRPRVDTLKGSKHANMKEMRLKALATECGGSPSLLIQNGRRCCLWRATNPAAARRDFIGN